MTLCHYLCNGLCIDFLVNMSRKNRDFADQEEGLTVCVDRVSDVQNSHSIVWERVHKGPVTPMPSLWDSAEYTLVHHCFRALF